MIKKTRDFIISFRFKKYGNFSQKEFIKVYSNFIALQQSLRQLFVYNTALFGAIQLRQIQLQHAETKEQKQQKALASAQCIMDTACNVMKAYASF